MSAPDAIRTAYEEGRLPVQGPCPCCEKFISGRCAAVVATEQTGPCVAIDCRCHGSRADGGLCEDCYVATK